MEGTVQALLMLPGATPKSYERARPGGVPLRPYFEGRLATLSAAHGEPRIEIDPAWYPHAEVLAGWRRDSWADAPWWQGPRAIAGVPGPRTLVLVLERDARAGAAVVLWCVTDGERETLAEAARTRPARVGAANFQAHVDGQIARVVEPGLHRPLARMMLVDDLAAVPGRAPDPIAGAVRDPDGEVRCVAAEVALQLGLGLPAVQALLGDPEHWVRWHVTGLLSGYGDDTAVEPLVAALRTDPDLGVRGQVAYALGHLGSPAAIPHLLHALDHDREYDEQGHSPSSTSATALDNILGTNQTRIKHDGGYCSLAPWPPDYDTLRREAEELYRAWSEGRDAG